MVICRRHALKTSEGNPVLMDKQWLKMRFPRASQGFLKANEDKIRSQIPNPKPKRHKTPALGSTIQGEKKSLERVTVRFTGYRVRPLDPDNFAGSCKDLLDGLVHASLLHGDETWRIIFETAQEKVSSYAEEKTVIEIDDGK